MCQFNFLVTNKNSHSSEIRKIVSDYGLNYEEYKFDIPNFVEIRTFLTTTNNCDCGSVLGKKYSDDSSESDWSNEQKKLERKRFSKRRIELLLEQKRREFAVKNSKEIELENNESKKWSEFLNDNRLKSKLNEIGILYHRFSGELKNEQIKVGKEKINLVETVNIEFFKNIKENELNWIKL
ncbi:hypothetical protein [Psychroflexus aestuariivivens]|uniref:hypothetical protein n=1 Tax=Psychroflexus aestuariivivens TaxID=1795040 RepID=UPI000FD7D48E|nr:hypothetical protein [Psychroflexus aestuariivivens]